jgi:hypothetical protein
MEDERQEKRVLHDEEKNREERCRPIIENWNNEEPKRAVGPVDAWPPPKMLDERHCKTGLP